jgi:hypothetical protein
MMAIEQHPLVSEFLAYVGRGSAEERYERTREFILLLKAGNQDPDKLEQLLGESFVRLLDHNAQPIK